MSASRLGASHAAYGGDGDVALPTASAGTLTFLDRPTTIQTVRTKKPRRNQRIRAGARRTRVDSLKIVGQLGPVGSCELEIRPLTVIVGRQGTGKSLIAQVLYSLEELPFLAQYIAAQKKRDERLDSEAIFGRVLDQLRSAERRFARFASKNTRIEWRRGTPWELSRTTPRRGQRHIRKFTFAFAIHPKATRTYTMAKYHKLIERFTNGSLRTTRHAVFVPTERMVISQLRTALADKVLALPITYELFADWLERATEVQEDVQGKEVDLIDEQSRLALGGEVKRVGEQWKWSYTSNERNLDLDMASSGQRANWSIGYLARAFFGLRTQRDYAHTLTMFVEEPEAHLHPEAQVAIVRLLAVLVNSGFRVILTTHSLACIYTINNLLLARAKLMDNPHRSAPDPLFRLRAEDVAVYAIRDGVPRDIVNRKEKFIDEHELGDVGAELGAEMNALLNLDV